MRSVRVRRGLDPAAAEAAREEAARAQTGVFIVWGHAAGGVGRFRARFSRPRPGRRGHEKGEESRGTGEADE